MSDTDQPISIVIGIYRDGQPAELAPAASQMQIRDRYWPGRASSGHGKSNLVTRELAKVLAKAAYLGRQEGITVEIADVKDGRTRS